VRQHKQAWKGGAPAWSWREGSKSDDDGQYEDARSRTFLYEFRSVLLGKVIQPNSTSSRILDQPISTPEYRPIQWPNQSSNTRIFYFLNFHDFFKNKYRIQKKLQKVVFNLRLKLDYI
jgi:hypothetical protein